MILGIRASGRANANSSHLLDLALEAACAKPDSTKLPSKTVDLARLTFRGCTGCGGCRAEGAAGGCVLTDELTPVLADVAQAEAVILAAPNYYGYLSGICKSFLDRWYGFRDHARNLRLPKGRPLLFIHSQGHPDPEAYAPMLAGLERIFTGYGFDPELLVAPGLEASGAAGRDEALVQLAHEAGNALRKKLSA